MKVGAIMDQLISLSAIAGKFSESSPGYIVQSWLRDRSSLEFLMYWEVKCNPDFDKAAYEVLMGKTKENGFTLTPKTWIEQTKAIGMTSKQGRNGGTFADQAIACEFMMWLSPRYRLMMIETFLLTEEGGDYL